MKNKKRWSVMLAFLMVLTSSFGFCYAKTDAKTSGDDSTAAEKAVFSDIEEHWAEAIIEEAAELKIVGGYPDGTFLPDNLIKREEFYKLLSNILTVTPDTSQTKVLFTDVQANEWYVPTIKIAVASGITSGYGDGTFGIGLMISRQEAAKVAGSVISSDVEANSKGADTAKDKAAIADWAYNYVDRMFKKGYMKGDTEGNFRPTMALTRAEAAVILLNLKKNEDVIAASVSATPLAGCTAIHSGEEGLFTIGKGTETSPYEIYTEAQLNHIRMHTTEGAFYILKKNIAITEDYATQSPRFPHEPDWSTGNFQPIGDKLEPFEGNLDGNGFTISGLNIIGIEKVDEKIVGADYAALFGCVAERASVKDLILDASTVSGGNYTGGIAGYNEGSINDCQLGSKGIINGEQNTGGLVGYSNYPLSSLRNKGTVKGKSMNTGGVVGSICAPGTALIYCKNEGTVTGGEQTGGIVGNFVSAQDSESSIKECDNPGTVTGGIYSAGGIAGYAGAGYYRATIENCGNSGEVTGTGVNGGIAGLLDKGKSLITQCKNTGTVEGGNAGGIVGNNKGEIAYCYNSGTVTASSAGGGIAAYQTEAESTITKSYNEGSVVANNCSGGIVGENGTTVNYCYNSGKVRGTTISGGVAGKNGGTIKYVCGAGVVTSEGSSGSLTGRNYGALASSFWLNTTNDLAVGIEDTSAKQQSVMRATHEQLSGQEKIKTQDGYVMLIDLLNEKTEAWEYLYTILIPAPGNTSSLSDGGGVVSPIEVPSTDNKGNTIDSSDLTSKYLYPAIID